MTWVAVAVGHHRRRRDGRRRRAVCAASRDGELVAVRGFASDLRELQPDTGPEADDLTAVTWPADAHDTMAAVLRTPRPRHGSNYHAFSFHI
jgi:hypothetical protein